MVGNLPPGFRFHPTDEELIIHYLQNQAKSNPLPISIIPEIDIYKFDPWELPEKAEFGEKEWYFFSPRDRKYPNGARPNRASVSGYWKATGTDKSIFSGSKNVGVKKSLVFYKGKPPKGIKTDWIMHEYRLIQSRPHLNKQNHSMRLDDWVLCRIYKKKNPTRISEQRVVEESFEKAVNSNDAMYEKEDGVFKFPRTCSLTHLWEFDYMDSISQLLDEDIAYHLPFNNQETSISDNGVDKYQVQMQNTDPMKFQVNSHHPVFVNQACEMQ